MTSHNEYQKEVVQKLRVIFGENVVLKEHSSRINQGNSYSPKIDILLKPEAEQDGVTINERCNNLMIKEPYLSFIKQLESRAINSGFGFNFNINLNPRYFIGIENENATLESDLKHVLGSIVNLSVLCKIGILVALRYDRDSLERLNEYFRFVFEKKRKIRFRYFENVILIKRKDFDIVLDSLRQQIEH